MVEGDFNFFFFFLLCLNHMLKTVFYMLYNTVLIRNSRCGLSWPLLTVSRAAFSWGFLMQANWLHAYFSTGIINF